MGATRSMVILVVSTACVNLKLWRLMSTINCLQFLFIGSCSKNIYDNKIECFACKQHVQVPAVWFSRLVSVASSRVTNSPPRIFRIISQNKSWGYAVIIAPLTWEYREPLINQEIEVFNYEDVGATLRMAPSIAALRLICELWAE